MSFHALYAFNSLFIQVLYKIMVVEIDLTFIYLGDNAEYGNYGQHYLMYSAMNLNY